MIKYSTRIERWHLSQEQLVDIYNRGYHAIKGWWNQQADAACSQQMINDEMKPGGQSAGSDQAVTMLTYTALSLYTELIKGSD